MNPIIDVLTKDFNDLPLTGETIFPSQANSAVGDAQECREFERRQFEKTGRVQRERRAARPKGSAHEGRGRAIRGGPRTTFRPLRQPCGADGPFLSMSRKYTHQHHSKKVSNYNRINLSNFPGSN